MKKNRKRITLILIRQIVRLLLRCFLLLMRIDKRKLPLYFHGPEAASRRAGVWCNELIRFASDACGIKNSMYISVAINQNGYISVAKWPPNIDKQAMKGHLRYLALAYARDNP